MSRSETATSPQSTPADLAGRRARRVFYAESSDTGSDERNTIAGVGGVFAIDRFAAYMEAQVQPFNDFRDTPRFRDELVGRRAGSDDSAAIADNTTVPNAAFGSSSGDEARPKPPDPLPRKWDNMKHMVCAYWLKGYCKYPEPVCQYAHVDTGIHAERPTPPARGYPAMAGNNLRHVTSRLRENGVDTTEPLPSDIWVPIARDANNPSRSHPPAHGFGPRLQRQHSRMKPSGLPKPQQIPQLTALHPARIADILVRALASIGMTAFDPNFVGDIATMLTMKFAQLPSHVWELNPSNRREHVWCEHFRITLTAALVAEFGLNNPDASLAAQLLATMFLQVRQQCVATGCGCWACPPRVQIPINADLSARLNMLTLQQAPGQPSLPPMQAQPQFGPGAGFHNAMPGSIPRPGPSNNAGGHNPFGPFVRVGPNTVSNQERQGSMNTRTRGHRGHGRSQRTGRQSRATPAGPVPVTSQATPFNRRSYAAVASQRGAAGQSPKQKQEKAPRASKQVSDQKNDTQVGASNTSSSARPSIPVFGSMPPSTAAPGMVAASMSSSAGVEGGQGRTRRHSRFRELLFPPEQ